MASAVYKLKLGVALAAVAVPSLFGALVTSSLVDQAYAAPRKHTAAPRSAPIINRVVFEKNKKVNSDQLGATVESKSGDAFSEEKVNADIARMKEAYNRVGRSTVLISYRTVPLPNNRVDLVFTVAEGVKVGIEEIKFVGNNNFSDWRLKRQMATMESGYLSWLRTTDTYDPDRLSNDEDRLREFYANHGYPDFRVLSVVPSLNAAQDAYIITITVDEGKYYKFGQSTVTSNVSDIDPGTLQHNVHSWENWTYRGEDVDKSVEDMTIQLAGSGHPFTLVRPVAQRNESGDTVGVNYVVEEGAKVYIERINIRGNTRTRDYVIRREFDIGEGDPYNKALIDRAARRLRNLGYFKSVKITNEPGSEPDRVIVDVDVEDQSTGEFSVGGGYSTSDGLLGSVSLTERNFLGRGQYVKVSAQYGQYTQGYGFSFTEPYFLGQRIAAGFDLFANQQDANDYQLYEQKTTGGTLRAAFPITDNFTVGVNYTIYQEKVDIPNAAYYDGNLANGEVSDALKQLYIEGSRLVSMAGYSLTYNTLDDLKQPSSGVYVQFKQNVAGLGGDAKFIQQTLDSRYYYSLTDDFTLMFRAQGGYMKGFGHDKLAIIDQFNPGPDLVRGFAPGGLGVHDTGSGDPKDNGLGGTTYFGGTVELQFPIFGLPREVGLRGAIFADAGTVYGYGGPKSFPDGTIKGVKFGGDFTPTDNHTIRASAGASLLWASPLGPLRFDYSFVLKKARYDQTQAFHFGTITNF